MSEKVVGLMGVIYTAVMLRGVYSRKALIDSYNIIRNKFQ